MCNIKLNSYLLAFLIFYAIILRQKDKSKIMLWILYNRGKNDYNVTSIRMSCAAYTQGLNFKKVYSEDCEIIDEKLYLNNELVKVLPDIVFSRCYNYPVLEFFERQNIKIINPLPASKRARSKYETYLHVCKMDNVSQPLTMLENELSYNEIVQKLGLPFVMKNNFGSLGKKCYLVKNKYQFSAIKRHNKDIEFIVQKFIETSYGKDIRIYVIGDEIIGGVVRKSIKGDFRANISLGGIFEPFDIPKDLQTLALKIAKHCNLEICGLDFLFNNNEFVFCEINSNAGFTAFSKQKIMIRDKMMQYLDKKYHNLIIK